MKPPSKLNLQFVKYFCILFFCITTLIAFIPLNPSLPGDGPDSSWRFAISQALAQNLVFGRDIIFTFGPYGSIYTELYHPAVNHLTIWGSFFLGICYIALLVLLTKNRSFYWLLFYGVLLVIFINSRDTLLFSYPFLLALFIYRIILPDIHPNKLRLSQTSMLLGIMVLSVPLGLLPLIKGSFLLICSAISTLCTIFLFYYKHRIAAAFAFIIPLLSIVIFWYLSAQPIANLPGFFVYLNQIISGYNEAMASSAEIADRKSIQILLYIFSAMLTFYTLLSSALGTKVNRLFLLLSYSLFLFIAFKAGFVRHDGGHNVMASAALFIIAFSLALLLKNESTAYKKSIFICIIFIILAATSIGIHNIIKYSLLNIGHFYITAYDGLNLRLGSTNKLKEKFDSALTDIHKKNPIPALSGTTDIYSYNQSWLLASNNVWNPRPIFQSYSAYTPKLAQLNLKHLQEANAPDNILFNVEPIDNRLPAIEDGLSWPTLINNYSIVNFNNKLLYLQKKPTVAINNPIARDYFYRHEYSLNEEVILPATKQPLFAKIVMEPTLLGKIITIFFKPPELNIFIKLTSGSTKNYRVVSGMLASGFIITPFVENTQDFALLATHKNIGLIDHIVKSFHLSTNRLFSLFWRNHYSLYIYKLNFTENDYDEKKR